MSSAFCSKSYRCKNKNWCAKDYNPELDNYECFEPMTNADKIRKMTGEELADFLDDVLTDGWNAGDRNELKYPYTDKEWLDWLTQEVTEDACL